MDDRTFAVHMRIKVGSGGLPCLRQVHDYLRSEGAYAIHSAGMGAYNYTNDPKMIMDCVEKFDIKVLGLPKTISLNNLQK